MANPGDIGLWTVPLAVLGGAIRVSTPFLFVSLGECITERSGRINLGLEGTLVMGAMSGYGVSYLTGSPWLGVLAAGVTGAAMGALHAGICGLPRVNDIAVGIALMLFGVGLAFYLGKPLIEPTAPRLPSIDLGWWSDIPQLRAALRINVLFLIGVALAPILVWALRTTRWGLIIRTAGESADLSLIHIFGAKLANPKITTQVIFTGDWSMPVKEAEATNSLIDQGVDVITCHVDGPKTVVENAARRGAMVTGYHVNQSVLAPQAYLTGAEWNWDCLLYTSRCV